MTQEFALAVLKAGKNVFLTGSAGAGKTYVLNQYIQYLRDRNVAVAVTASTGIAATHLNGQTIHSWCGMGIKDFMSDGDIDSLKSKKYLLKNMDRVKVLIIDEISMLHQRQFELVNRILQSFKENILPFGGIQLVLSGDFFQLPPIGIMDETSRDKFVFMSPAWLDAKLNICYLTEQFRQSDNKLNNILNEIRSCKLTEQSLQLLEEARHNELRSQEEPTKLFTHNRDVDSMNALQLRALPGNVRVFKAKMKGNKKLQETLKKAILAPDEIHLKIDAKVMFVKNNYEKGFVNGTMGKVIKYNDEGYPVVKTLENEFITAEPEKWSIDDETGKVLASYTQVPLRLAWAITVHKSQGMTLDEAELNLGLTFERGQGYVALSRLRSIENLMLTGFNETALQVDGLAAKADKRFIELSEDLEGAHTIKDLTPLHNVFIRASGGITDKKEIEKHIKKVKEKKGPKISTFEKTKRLIESGKSLSEIASERGLAESTIMGHLVKINDRFPDTDISAFAPPAGIQERVEKAFIKLKNENAEGLFTEDGEVRRKPIFEALNKEVDYGVIALCLMFMKGKNEKSI